MKKLFLYMAMLLIFTNCGSSESNEEDGKEDVDGTNVTVVLDVEEGSKPSKNIHLYGFDSSGKLVIHKYISDMSALGSEMLLLNDGGDYIFVAVLNVGEAFTPPTSKITKAVLPNITLSDFMAWLKEIAVQYPDIMTGMVKELVAENGVLTIRIEIKDGTDNVKSTILRLSISLPDTKLPDYTTRVTSRTADYNLRAVAEVYKKGTTTRVHSYSGILSGDKLELNLLPGIYDILLWVDYTQKDSKVDHYYTTSSLSGVMFSEAMDYTASTDSRDAFSLSFESTVTENSVTEQDISLERPLAKYQIVATDVERYKRMMSVNEYPPLEELTINISYEGNFPNSFNVKADMPNDAIGGIEFISLMTDVSETRGTLGRDYVFVNGAESSVTVAITITDSEGREITKVSGVEIEYRRGYLTTIEGDFLTAGIVDGGISIETNWEDVINVEF